MIVKWKNCFSHSKYIDMPLNDLQCFKLIYFACLVSYIDSLTLWRLCEEKKMLIYMYLIDFMKCFTLTFHWLHLFWLYLLSPHSYEYWYNFELEGQNLCVEFTDFIFFLSHHHRRRTKNWERKTPFSVTWIYHHRNACTHFNYQQPKGKFVCVNLPT